MGATYLGGSNGQGTIFNINTTNSTFEVAHHGNLDDFDFPFHGPFVELNNKLWSSSYFGKIFNIDPSNNVVTVVHDTKLYTAGHPLLPVNGELWGSSFTGGTSGGLIYSIDPDGSNYTIIKEFDNYLLSFGKTAIIEYDGKVWAPFSKEVLMTRGLFSISIQMAQNTLKFTVILQEWQEHPLEPYFQLQLM
ncbi:MAG: hypothetical protein GY816_18015 [Cytophagales bacterium]|nr:hypothetical protein [Cytophagales bacterium]